MQSFHRRVLRNPWVPHKPTHRQALFLLHDDVFEVGYGGAAMGGKTDALLMAAAMYVDHPRYVALLVRKTMEDMKKANSIFDRAKQWWLKRPGISFQGNTFTFPSGARISFAYCKNYTDALSHNSAEYHFLASDELPLIDGAAFTYLISRVRRLVSEKGIPARVRTAFNPPATISGAWVKTRYLSKAALECQRHEKARYFQSVWWKDGRAFIPARKEDNPYGDLESYQRSLDQQDPVTRLQLSDGDMTAHAGGRFHRTWFPRFKDITDALIVGTYSAERDLVHKNGLVTTVWVDPANRPKRSSKYTAFHVGAQDRYGRLFVLDVVRKQMDLTQIVPELYKLCCRYNAAYAGFEANGFQLALVNEARNRELYPRMPPVKEVEPHGKSKLTRATPAVVMASEGQIIVPEESPWLEDWFAEMEMFTGEDELDTYTDQVDTLAYNVLDLREQFGNAASAITA
jgi:predicted phage terminase large subunit-like protein